MYRRYVKRGLDIILALTTLIVLMPVMLIVAALIKIKLGSPVIFKQRRPGKDEKIFTMYKFRTMSDEKNDKGELMPDVVRLTKFGKALRSMSLDELPELINIIRGEMSIVGPRPLATIYLPYYNDFERRRHEVRPGLTGLAQVNGRNAISWEEKFSYDVAYVDHITFLGDCKIVLKTFLKVVKRSEIGQAEEAPESFHVVRMKQLKQEGGA